MIENAADSLVNFPNFGAWFRVCKTVRVPKPRVQSSPQSPVVTFREEVAGRETLAAIADARVEALHPLAHRAPTSTQIYGDRISNAPGAVSPKTARALDDAPEVTVTFLPAGRVTHAELGRALRDDGPSIEIAHEEVPDSFEWPGAGSEETTAVVGLAIEQQHTFIVRTPAHHLKPVHVRRQLLVERLLPTLADRQLEDVTKVVVEAHGEQASLVRFWTKVR